MNKGLAILMMLAFWGFVIWFFFKALGSIGRARTSGKSTQEKLLDKKIITKEEFQNIEKWEFEEKLKRWKKADLISQEQMDAALNPKTKNFLSMATSLLYLGIGCVVIGIISLIAANYDKIPPMVRLTSTFLLFVASNLGVYYSKMNKKDLAFEGFLASSIGLVGALIGLIFQTFHFKISFDNALFLWALLALPFAVMSVKKWFALAWYPIFTMTFFFSSYGRDFMHVMSTLFSLPVIYIAFAFIIFSIYDLLVKNCPKHPFTEALKCWGIIYGVSAIILIDSFYVEGSRWYRKMHRINGWDYIFSVVTPANILLLIFSAIYPLMHVAKNGIVRYYMYFLMAFGVVCSAFVAPFFGAILTLVTISFAATYFARQNQIKFFNCMICAFFIRIIFAYFNLFMSMVSTGISAIILGILILIGVKVWLSYKKDLINYIQKGK